MSKFVIPSWDTNDICEEIHNKLFKKKEKNASNKVKSKFQHGRIEKAKLRRKKISKNIKDNLETAKKQIEKNKAKIKKKSSNIKSKSKDLVDSVKLNVLKHQSKEGAHLLSENENSFNDKNLLQTDKKRRKKKLNNLKNKISNIIDADIEKIKEFKKKNVEKSKGVNKKKSKLKTSIDKFKNKYCTDENRLLKKTPKKKSLSLRERMLEKLKASRFRYLNEQIYSSESKQAEEMFKNDPEAFEAYHEGYRQQVERWPINPVDIIINSIKKMSKNISIADFGCGDAKISKEVNQKVHSFDLVATNERVTACDVTKTPLKNESMDVVVFCLSLMGTNLHDYIKEANRVLKIGGILKIAEVESRFDDIDEFIKGVHCFGFKNTLKDLSYNIFYFIDFKKISNVKKNRNLPTISLHPCLYKKR